MTPREFLDQVVRPNISDFHNGYNDFRYAYNAVASVDALAAHIFYWCKLNEPARVSGQKDDTAYREHLAKADPNFRLLRDTAKAQKHVQLINGRPEVSAAKQMGVRTIAFGQSGFGQGRFGGVVQCILKADNGDEFYVENIVDGAMNFLEKIMSEYRI